ncbi:MFS transporter [Martelella endophytica]|uniref:MFS transporter n=1 Tax=Martelella endophytica TaxID=1486262 RepID=UPI0005F0D207|nr:MFS transporter [Martelella endophytica]
MSHNRRWNTEKRSLAGACLVHALHDGYTDALYAFMPVWQAQFGLSYAALAAIRALYYATMGGLQMPANHRLRGWTPRAALILSTAIAAIGLIFMSLPFGLTGLCVGLMVAGIGSSIQHPCASVLVSESFGTATRRPLGIYNFSGDLGKAALPALVALLLPVMSWRPVLGLMAALGLALIFALMRLLPAIPATTYKEKRPKPGSRRDGFRLLTVIGGFDTATRMGYLLFLPFLVEGRGGSLPTVGIALALVFIGGAFGKAIFGDLGERLGVVRTVMIAEATTASLIVATLFTSLPLMLMLLPLLGLVLNGTSSVLYGTVPELSDGDTGRAFAIFYTSVIGSGGIAPILYGAIADNSSRTLGIVATAATAALILPLVLALGPHLTNPAATVAEPRKSSHQALRRRSEPRATPNPEKR